MGGGHRGRGENKAKSKEWVYARPGHLNPDEAAAQEAQSQAEEALRGASEETDIKRAQLELAEANARYQAAQKLKGIK